MPAGGRGAAGSAAGASAGASGTGALASGSGGAGGDASAAAGSGASAAGGGGASAAAGTGAPPEAGSGAPTAPGDLFIAPDGNDANAGTEAMPLGSLATAVMRAKPGATIWVAAGKYPLRDPVALGGDGQESAPLRIFAREGERPVFDFAAQPRDDSGARGFRITGTYWHLRGFDVANAGDNCIHISGSHNTIEQVNTYGCSDTGIQISADSSDAGDPTRAAHNTIVDCDSHDNYDAANQGENADGFAAKLYIGPGNVFRGCRAWNNADDGWDFFASDDAVIVEDCWAMSNGKIGPAQNNTNGDGNGFKLGGAPRAGDPNMGGAVHVVTRSISIENRACGFVLNNNTETPKLSMCGGRGDGKGLLCSLTNSGNVTVSMTAAEAVAAKRDANGKLPPIR